MGLDDIFLKHNNGTRFKLDNLKQEIKREDYANDSKLQAIFDFFDIDNDKDGKISSVNTQGENELKSIFEQLKKADEDGNGIIDDSEANNFIEKFLQNKNISAKDFFKFLSSLIKRENKDEIALTQKDANFTYTLTLKNPNASEGELTWEGDSLKKFREVYPDAYTPYLKNGIVIIHDKEGNPIKDKNGNEVKVDYISKRQTFSQDLAEIIVLGHKASFMEKLLHQAEIQQELDRLNSLPPSEESYTELMRSIAFEQMSKKEQTEALLKWTGEKFYNARERGDLSAMKEYLVQGFGLAFQKMDMASVGNTNISVEGFKNFLKNWSGLDAFCEQMDNFVNDGTDNITRSEKIWNFTKGVGDSIDHFIGTQGIAFIGTLALASEAAAAGGIGEVWAVAIQSYFAFEGIGSIAEGVTVLKHAETAEEYRQAGDMVGTGAIMVHGAVKSFKGALTGKLQAGLEVKKALKEIKETKSFEEVKELQENLSDLPYNEQEKQVILLESQKQLSKIAQEKVGTLDAIKNSLNAEGVSYEVFADKDGNTIIRIVASSEREDVASGVKFTFDCYKYDKNGNIVDFLEKLSQKEIKLLFGKTKKIETVDNSDGSTSGFANVGLPVPSVIRNKFNGYMKTAIQPTQLIPNQTNLFSGIPKTLDDVMRRIQYVCNKYGFNYNSIVNTFMKNLNIDLSIFDSEVKLYNYIKQCIDLYNTKDNHNLPTYNKKLYNFRDNYIMYDNVDTDLIKDIALLSATDTKIAQVFDRICYLYEQGSIDQFSLKKVIRYIREGYISPETFTICLDTGLINKGHIDICNIVDSTVSTNPNIIKARKQTINTIERAYPELKPLISELQKDLGNDIYRIKWDCLNLKDLDSKGFNIFLIDVKNLIYLKNTELTPDNFYIKINGYGKNEQWAREMVDITEQASTMISDGKGSDEVLAYLAQETRTLSLSNGKFDYGRATSQGILRSQRDGYFCDNSISEHGAITSFEANQYSSYAERFRETAKHPLTNPYEGRFELTRLFLEEEYPIDEQSYDPNNPKHGYSIDENGNKHYYEKTGAMVHPKGKYVSGALDVVKEKQDFVINKYKGKALTKKDLNDINEIVAEIHWILSHSMPWGRGSAGISQAYVLSIYQSLGLKVYPPKEGISFDLEAFCTELSDYKQKYKYYYEKEPEIIK